jgi:ADP-heptose:LPS heptosyltransferase
MHLFTTTDTIRTSECDLLPGTYVMEDLHAAQFMLAGKAGSTSIEKYSQDNTNSDSPKKILVVRPGVYGDLLLLTPTLNAIRKKYPHASITVAAFSRYQSILLGTETIIDYPVKPEQISEYDCVFFMERIIEGNPDAIHKHAVDLFAEKAFVEVPDTDKMLNYKVLDREVEWAKARYPRTEKKRVAIHVSASTQCRNWPQENMVKLIIELAKDNREVFLIGAPGQIGAPNKGSITNLALEGLDIRQSIAAMSTCDVLVAPDSVMLHAASAIGMKAIGLFGPIKWQNRVTGKTTYSIQGHTECEFGACGHNANAREGHFPSYCPTRKNNFCALMAQIKPERVLAKINMMLQ